MRPLKSYNLALVTIILAAFFGGAIPVLSKIALNEIPPISFVFFRFLIASIIILPFFLREIPKISVLKIVFISLFATVNVTLFAFGVRLTTADVGQMLYTTVPIIVIVLSYILLKEKTTLRRFLGVIIGFAGAIMIILLPILGRGTIFSGNLVGNLLIFTAVISFSIYSVLSKKLQEQCSPICLTSLFIFTTTVILFILLPFDAASHPNWWQSVSTSGILSTLYVGIFGTAVYYLLYQYSIKHGTPTIASITLYIQPIVTFLVAYVILGEQLTAFFIIGSILVFLSAWIITRKNSKNKSNK
jgi:drug/metabolite transporter (DMT)-like permease